MRRFMRLCHWFIITSIVVLSFSSPAQSSGDEAFSILQSFDYSNDPLGNLPDNVMAHLYDEKDNILYVIGWNHADMTELGPIQTLYIWQYDTNNHLLSFTEKAALNFQNSEYINFKIVAKIEQKLILSIHNNLDLRNTLSSIYLKDGFKFIEEVDIFPADSVGDFKAVQSSEKTIFAYLISVNNVLLAKHCTIMANDTLCQEVSGDYPELLADTYYRSSFLDGLDQFIIYPSYNQSSEGHIYILRYDESGQLSILNKINLPSTASVDHIATRPLKSELFIYSTRTNDYPNRRYQFDGKGWGDAGLLPDQQVDMERIQYVNDTNYGVTTNCRPAIYSEENTKFYYTQKSAQNEMLGGYCILIDDVYGVGLEKYNKIIRSFKLVNTQPTMVLESLNNVDFVWTQDQYNEIDMRKYFSNSTELTINGLPSVLKFDGTKISGELGKDDLFVETATNYFTPIERSQVEVYSDGKLLTSFFINYVNINDAPELIFPIKKEYLKSGVSYEISVQELVRDPDYDSPLSFTFTNLPPNTTLDGYGGLKMIPAKTGDYKIGVTVDDGHGGVLKFTLDVEVNDSGNASAAGGGGGLGMNMLSLLLLLWLWRNRESSVSLN